MNDRDAELVTQMLAYCAKIDERIEEFGIDEDSFVENSAYAGMLRMPCRLEASSSMPMSSPAW